MPGNAAASGPVVAPNPDPAPAPIPVVGFEPAYGPSDGFVARRGGSSQHATPRRPQRRRRILSTLLIVLGVALMAAAGGMWTYAQLQYRAQDEANAKLATYASVSDDPAAPEGPQVDWAALKAVNPDVVGWVQIPGTVVNYPVYQARTTSNTSTPRPRATTASAARSSSTTRTPSPASRTRRP